MSRAVRIVLIVVGVVVVLVGIVAWSIEDAYGSGLDYSMRPSDGGVAVFESSAGSEPVFVGSRDEAFEYMDEQRSARESFVIPRAIIAAGAVLVIAGALAGRASGRTRVSPE